MEGIDSVREVTEKLVRDCVTLWATGQNGASGEHWREQILRSSWRELAPWRSEDLNRVIQQVRQAFHTLEAGTGETRETYLGPQTDSVTGTSDTSPIYGAQTALLATAGKVVIIYII